MIEEERYGADQKTDSLHAGGKEHLRPVYLDEDYNVPDQKEDVKRIIQGKAELRAEDIRPVENYVKIAGKMYFTILYMTSSEIRSLPYWKANCRLRRLVYAESDGNESFYLRK